MALDLCSNTASPAPDSKSNTPPDIAQVIMERRTLANLRPPCLGEPCLCPCFQRAFAEPKPLVGWGFGL